jgi:hypothetical protein
LAPAPDTTRSSATVLALIASEDGRALADAVADMDFTVNHGSIDSSIARSLSNLTRSSRAEFPRLNQLARAVFNSRPISVRTDE